MNKQFPEYDSCIKGVVLSANDLIASVLLLYEDEGYSPLNIVSVNLPTSTRAYRENNPEGKSLYHRGDIITIECKITKCETQEDGEKFIKELAGIIMDESEEGDTRINQMDSEEQTAKYWVGLEQRDLAKRQTNVPDLSSKPEAAKP